MLKSLSIKNYALIQSLEIHPSTRLNIITGETGAGKSIMLGALGLIMGNRADTKSLYSEKEKCVVEGEFDISKLDLQSFFEENDIDYSESSILRREIVPSGKSRAFINDQPVTLDVLKEIGERLMDIHSQHDTLKLGSNIYQLSLLDTYSRTHDLINGFLREYSKYQISETEYHEWLEKAQELKKELDYNSFLLSELKKLKLENLNQTELEEELKVLENAESIKEKLFAAYGILNNEEFSTLILIKEAMQSVQQIAQYSSKYKEISGRLSGSLIELQDLVHEIEIESSNIETDPEKLIQIKENLNHLYSLQKKHGVDTVEELILLRDRLDEKVNQTISLDDKLKTLKETLDKNKEHAGEAAVLLSKARKNHVTLMEKQTVGLLKEIGLPDATMQIQMTEKPLSADGIDLINFQFSANKGIPEKPLKDVASGGEFSRLMLALKYVLAKKGNMPTIIFDEIDTGISGEVAVKVGKLLQDMAMHLQVIAITHLPQIAGKEGSHFYVYKDNSLEKTISKMRLLSKDERIKEIATMIGGQNPSETAMKSARELLSL